MSLKENLNNDLKTAMKSGDTLRVSVLRLLKSEIRNAEIDGGAPLTDDEILQVITKAGKQRREAIEQFRKGNRPDLADKESAELQILSEYLPKQMDEGEIAGIAREVISELHATSKADKGKVMSAMMPKVRGKADGKLVSQVVDNLLASNSA